MSDEVTEPTPRAPTNYSGEPAAAHPGAPQLVDAASAVATGVFTQGLGVGAGAGARQHLKRRQGQLGVGEGELSL